MNLEALFTRLGGIKPAVGNKFTPMTEAQVAAVETALEIQLPEAYRTFLTKYGAASFQGASPDNPFIKFRSMKPLPPNVSTDDKGLFSAFYGAEQDEHDPHSLGVRARFFEGRMPETLIPIGDSWGNQICLGVKGAESGKVYYWDQQNEPLDQDDYLEDYGEPRPPEAMFQNVYLIADSFEDFLLLQP